VLFGIARMERELLALLDGRLICAHHRT
jgi:hypothetical protein